MSLEGKVLLSRCGIPYLRRAIITSGDDIFTLGRERDGEYLTFMSFEGECLSSLLCEFRARLLHNGAEQRLFERLLSLGRERGWLKVRGKQRTDSTHVVAAVRALNRLEGVGETLRHALNTLAEADPQWLGAHLPSEWIDRYAKRFASVRLPQGKEAREALALSIGEDGFPLARLAPTTEYPHSAQPPARNHGVAAGMDPEFCLCGGQTHLARHQGYAFCRPVHQLAS